MSKHTPGPWEVQHEYGRHYSIKKDGYWIGRCKGAENAQLIAAAPDLLLELDNCLDLLVTCLPDSPDNSRIGVAITKARAAIAKAEGEL